jgi:hypothetical protein
MGGGATAALVERGVAAWADRDSARRRNLPTVSVVEVLAKLWKIVTENGEWQRVRVFAKRVCIEA